MTYLNVGLALFGLTNVTIIYGTNWSFTDYTVILIIVWFILLGFTFSQVSSSMKTLAELIDMRETNEHAIVRFVLSSLALGVFLFLFIHRIYYLGSFVGFNILSIILCLSIACAVLILIYQNKNFFEGIRHLHTITKGLVLSFLLICFLIPLVVGVFIPIFSDPSVVVFPMPREIFYEGSEQVQDVKKVDLSIKAEQGYAWNINIKIEAPPSFYFWLDGIENKTKNIAFLESDEVVTSSLALQPSHIVTNGIYDVRIVWSYESASGHLTSKSTSVMVIIDQIVLFHYDVNPWVAFLTVAYTSGIGLIYLLERRRKQKLAHPEMNQ